MTTFREREKRLAALEAEAEAKRQAEAITAAALAADGPPYWAECTICGNASDPREQDPDDRRCLWCGGVDFGLLNGTTNHYGAIPSRFVCPRCGDTHGRPARRVSEWNRAGACPACDYAPPPPPSQGDTAFDRWLAVMVPEEAQRDP